MRPGPYDEMRARVEIDGLTYLLPRGTDVVALRERIEAAARVEPTFVSFATSDGLASVLVHPTSRVRASDDGTLAADLGGLPDWDV
ncbi:unnamed protein product [Penicillium discolor]